MNNMVDVVGQRKASLSIQKGVRYSTKEALRIGLVDELCPPDQLLNRARQEVTKWLAVPGESIQYCGWVWG